MTETQTFTAAPDVQRSLRLPPARCRSAPAAARRPLPLGARCRSAPAAPVTDQQLDYVRAQGWTTKDDSYISGGDSAVRQAKEGVREIASAKRATSASDLADVIEACARLKTKLAEEVAEMEAEDLELERLDACRLGLQGLVLYALQTASRTAGNALSSPDLWALRSEWWLVDGGYGWEDLDKALPLTTDDASVAFYRFIGPALTKKVYDALVIIARQQCGPAVAAFQAAKRLSMAEGPKVEYQVHSGVELGEPRRESVQEVLKQVADDDIIKAVLELLPKSSFCGEPMTSEEILAELRESLEATGDLDPST
ncbi:hypothetical protein JCM10296v2_001576 [Rhodotorula toruloides]